MIQTSLARSPIHPWWEARQPQWSSVGGIPIPHSLQSLENERTAAETLGLCDLSAPAKLGVKGNDAQSWLSQQGVDLPVEIYQSRRLADGGIVVRLGRDEFLLESGIKNETVSALELQFDSSLQHLYRIERQEATFLLVGSSGIDVMAQTCGVDLRKAVPRHLVYTRVAGVSCAVLPESILDIPAFRLWVDCSYALYLWETLLEICDDLGGCAIGAGSLFPELQ